MSERIAFEGLSNVRDLGRTPVAGGMVRSGVLYRSGQLAPATKADLRKLAGMNIGVVFDLRSVPEREEKPDPEVEGARNMHLPIIEDVRAGITRSSADDGNLAALMMSGDVDEDAADQHMRTMYREFVTEPCARVQYARFLDGVLEAARAGKAALWHCTAGKDRAGFATALVLGALGADRDDIVADYLQTNACLANAVDAIVERYGNRLPGDAARTALRRFFLADASYLEAAYDAIAESFGTVEAFLADGLGLDGEKRTEMRELLTTPNC